MRDRLLSRLEERRQDILNLTMTLVATPSENPPGDEQAMVARIEQEAEALGLHDREIMALEARRPNLIIKLTAGKPGPRLIYSAHTDTKPVGDRRPWQSDPLTPSLREGRIFGLGATDMKAAIAALLHAAGALAAEGLPSGELWLVLSADEEHGSRYGARYLAVERRLQADAGLVAEPSGIAEPWEFLAVVGRGISCFRCRVSGTQMHSSLADRVPAVNASVEAARLLVALAERFRPTYPEDPRWPQGVTLNAGAILSGGVTYGVHPGHAELGCDLRTVPGMTREDLQRQLEAFLEEHRRSHPQLQVELEFEPGAPGWTPPTEMAENHPLIEASLRAAEDVLGRRPHIGTMPAVTDAVWFQQAGIPTIAAFGPGLLTAAHAPNESVAAEEIVQAAQIYALTAEEFLTSS